MPLFHVGHGVVKSCLSGEISLVQHGLLMQKRTAQRRFANASFVLPQVKPERGYKWSCEEPKVGRVLSRSSTCRSLHSIAAYLFEQCLFTCHTHPLLSAMCVLHTHQTPAAKPLYMCVYVCVCASLCRSVSLSRPLSFSLTWRSGTVPASPRPPPPAPPSAPRRPSPLRRWAFIQVGATGNSVVEMRPWL